MSNFSGNGGSQWTNGYESKYPEDGSIYA
jgi:hypothetical protein